MASKEIEEESALERVAQDETEYNSVPDAPISTIKVLMRIEKVMNPQQLNVFCAQYAGEQPYHVELLTPYEASISYWEGVVIAVVAGRLMNAAIWNEIPLVVSCTLVPRERMDAIVKARENVKRCMEREYEKGR